MTTIFRELSDHTSYMIFFQCFIALAMIGIGNIDSLVDFFSFTAWMFYGTAAFSLLVMRYTKRDVKRIIKVSLELISKTSDIS